MFSTDRVTNRGGYEKRNVGWQMPLYRYDLSYVMRDRAAMDEILHYFNAVMGSAYGFRLKDPRDYSATVAQGFVYALTATTWQMRKRYTMGALTLDRNIKKPVSGTVAVSGGGTYSVDYTTGIITKSAGDDPTGWSGEFDVPVHFDDDSAQYLMVATTVSRWESIVLVELRNPG